ncbi:MAG: E3 ubiquitin-protein ligase synoviolin [Cirrosporium novae-zelandiae]|nr:MAG: E3 ubiquitin-protein ligase synoviolin [Cirrosporium novae-zelandiae]
MRFLAYAGTSVALASVVILRALHERANFYSATVYLSQSSACVMILTNLVLLGVFALMVGLQRLLFGRLRPLEVETLYEKAWYAITETCLAMTIFRDEIGGWFVVMFVSLLIGKAWCWLGEGRVDALERQPPDDPRLFHTRLITSLLISLVYDGWLWKYCLRTVLRQARPDMMVMFGFEFAVLLVGAFSTACRYTITAVELYVIKKQTRARIEERRNELRLARETALREASQNGNDPEAAVANIPGEESAEDMDVDVPGWEEKGRWVFYLDLSTDFCKLVIYVSFFMMMLTFYNFPIHIMRDVYLTARSFFTRLASFLRYRNATRDMNERYPDATTEDIRPDDVCIVCREEMRPWQEQIQPREDGQEQGRRGPPDERLRPKKLPCGHVLHFACLRSWLERQQNCPTCRRPVWVPRRRIGVAQRGIPPANGQAFLDPRQPPAQIPPQQAVPGNPLPGGGQNGPRIFNFGPLRLGFGVGQANMNMFQDGNLGLNNPQAQAAQQPPNVRHFGFGIGIGRPPVPLNPAIPNGNQPSIDEQLHQLEQRLMQEINGLRATADQLQIVRMLQGELSRIRIAQANPSLPVGSNAGGVNFQPIQPMGAGQAFITAPQAVPMGTGHPALPQGMVLPPGWSVLPLQRQPPPVTSQLANSSRLPSANISQEGTNSERPNVQSDSSSTQPTPQTTMFSVNSGQSPDPNLLGQARPSAHVTSGVESNTESDPTATTVTPHEQQSSGSTERNDTVNENRHTTETALEAAPTKRPRLATAESSTETKTMSTPSWSFGDVVDEPAEDSKGVVHGSGESSSSEENMAPEPSGDNGDITHKADKGKGRAVTVEDLSEDE